MPVRQILGLWGLAVLTACAVAPTTPTPPTGLRFLALGDSYTIGESIAEAERWPNQLAAGLLVDGGTLASVDIIARTGWTAGDLLAAMAISNPQGTYDLVSVQIGVNNQYRGYALENYRTDYETILAEAVRLAGGRPERVLALSIPDWGVTPFGARSNPAEVAEEIDLFNHVGREVAEAAGVVFIDITPISREAASAPELIAGDGLHPSGAMYARWVALVQPVACAALGLVCE